jgi:hypothetical protein
VKLGISRMDALLVEKRPKGEKSSGLRQAKRQAAAPEHSFLKLDRSSHD